jgi:hypothetical protein
LQRFLRIQIFENHTVTAATALSAENAIRIESLSIADITGGLFGASAACPSRVTTLPPPASLANAAWSMRTHSTPIMPTNRIRITYGPVTSNTQSAVLSECKRLGVV